MEGLPQGQAPCGVGGRKRRWLGCCQVEPRTLSSSAPAGLHQARPPLSPLAATAASANTATPGAAMVAEEARDQLRPLPGSLGLRRTSTANGAAAGRSIRSSMASFVASALAGRGSLGVRGSVASLRGSVASNASGGARKRSAAPSRTMGSLTAWQVLAAEVQEAMRAGASAAGLRWGSGSSRSSLGDTHLSSQGRSSHIEPHLIMSEQSDECAVPPAEGGTSRRSSSALLLGRQGSSRSRLSAGPGGSGAGSRLLPSDSSLIASVLAESAAAEGGGAGVSSDGSVDVAGSGRFEGQYEVLGELGRGAFGCALKARRRCDGALVCLKVLDSDSMGPAERRMSRDEVRVLSSMAHPNIVLYHDCFTEGGRQYIAMEFCEEGDLEQLLKGRRGALMEEDEVMIKFVQLCLALQHVHTKGIIHRDIKSGNIFCTRHGILKLGDFGISKIMAPGKSHARTMVGTPYYFSPELVEDKPYSKKADVWAAGCVLYELATLQRPFRGSSVSAIAVKILRGAYAPLPDHYSPELHQLVAALLRRKPDHRPSIDEVLGMEYVRRHMRRYRDHVQRTVEHRKQSYFNSLNMFQLDATCGGLAGQLPGGDVALAATAAAMGAATAGAGPFLPRERPAHAVGASARQQAVARRHRLSGAVGQLVVPPAAAAVTAATLGPAAKTVLPRGVVLHGAGGDVGTSPAASLSPVPASPAAAALPPPSPSAPVSVFSIPATLAATAGSPASPAAGLAAASSPLAPAAAAAPLGGTPPRSPLGAATAAAAAGASCGADSDAVVVAVVSAALPASAWGAAPASASTSPRPPKISTFSAVAHLQAAAKDAVAVAGGAAASVAAATAGASGSAGGSAPSPAPQQQRQPGTSLAAPVAAADPAEQQQQQERQQQQEQQWQQRDQQLRPLLASKKLRSLSSAHSQDPDSPQSALHFQRLGSLRTVASDATVASNADDCAPEEAGCSPGGSAWPRFSRGPSGTGASADVAPPLADPLLLKRGSDSVVDLARRAPGLLLQVQQLLDRSPVPIPPGSAGAGAGGDSDAVQLLGPEESEGHPDEVRTRLRRAADQACLEELRSPSNSITPQQPRARLSSRLAQLLPGSRALR